MTGISARHTSGWCSGNRDVVEDVVAREARGLSRKDASDQLVAVGVVIKKISRKADG